MCLYFKKKKEPVRLHKKQENKFRWNMISREEQLTIIAVILLLIFLIIFALYESISFFYYNRAETIVMIIPLLLG